MHGPDGTNYKTESVFVEIVKPERIVFDHVSAPQFRMTATFKGQLGARPGSPGGCSSRAAECATIRKIAVPGNEQNFDRLEAQLAKMA